MRQPKGDDSHSGKWHSDAVSFRLERLSPKAKPAIFRGDGAEPYIVHTMEYDPKKDHKKNTRTLCVSFGQYGHEQGFTKCGLNTISTSVPSKGGRDVFGPFNRAEDQRRLDFPCEPGSSGSPVFELIGDRTVRAVGMIIARTKRGDCLYSHMGYVQDEVFFTPRTR